MDAFGHLLLLMGSGSRPRIGLPTNAFVSVIVEGPDEALRALDPFGCGQIARLHATLGDEVDGLLDALGHLPPVGNIR